MTLSGCFALSEINFAWISSELAGVSTEVFTLFAVFAAVVFLVVVFLAAAALVTDVFPDVVFLAVPAVFSADETFVSAAFTVAAFAPSSF